MILRFLIFGSCYAQTHAFSAHFLHIFDDLFFDCQALFTHFLQKSLKTYQYLSYLASSVPPNISHCQHGGKILRNSQQSAKNQNYWGDGGQILGGDVSSRDLQPCNCYSYTYTAPSNLLPTFWKLNDKMTQTVKAVSKVNRI